MISLVLALTFSSAPQDIRPPPPVQESVRVIGPDRWGFFFYEWRLETVDGRTWQGCGITPHDARWVAYEILDEYCLRHPTLR